MAPADIPIDDDIDLECKECGEAFVFTSGEQEYYRTKGFLEIPQRCKTCRNAKKKREKDAQLLKQKEDNQDRSMGREFLSQAADVVPKKSGWYIWYDPR